MVVLLDAVLVVLSMVVPVDVAFSAVVAVLVALGALLPPSAVLSSPIFITKNSSPVAKV